MKLFTQSQVQAIADALGHPSEGLTGTEIGHLLDVVRMRDLAMGASKRIRLLNAFAESQNTRRDRVGILAFIRHAMKPERYLRDPARFEQIRTGLNSALLFAGLLCDESGALRSAVQVSTLGEAIDRARRLRSDLELRGVHADVLECCRSELLTSNYFHATFEAVKSIALKIRKRTGLDDDGAVLVDRALGGELPMLAINALRTKSERDEQRGFANLVKGVFGMFRNPLAHEPRVDWPIDEQDARDLLTMASLIHRKIDDARMLPRV